MIINHNMRAINTHRQMGATQTLQAKNMEKLSSGYRVNRAGDDAAGLAISEKMRGQIKGLNQASRNAQDGISLIQTAEGALSETQNIIQRMRELSVQASNDTNVIEDREALQSEINELTKEIDRISTDTEFNTQKLLDGTFADKKLQIGANENQDINIEIKSMTAKGLGISGLETTKDVEPTLKEVKVGEHKVVDTPASDAVAGSTESAAAYTPATIDGSHNTLTVGGNSITLDNGTNVSLDDMVKNINDKFAADAGNFGDYEAYKTDDGKIGVRNKAAGNGKDAAVTGNASTQVFGAGPTTTAGADAVTEVSHMEDTMRMQKVAPFKGGIDVTSHASAKASITKLDSANEQISSQRARLGAIQNRLEHTIANDNTAAENLQAAESRIRDVDMAKEMMDFTKNNILAQASQAMLAQANQAPQQVLQLLR